MFSRDSIRLAFADKQYARATSISIAYQKHAGSRIRKTTRVLLKLCKRIYLRCSNGGAYWIIWLVFGINEKNSRPVSRSIILYTSYKAAAHVPTLVCFKLITWQQRIQTQLQNLLESDRGYCIMLQVGCAYHFKIKLFSPHFLIVTFLCNEKITK